MTKKGKNRAIKQVKSKRKTFSKHKRWAIFLRDKFICQLCSKDLKDLPEERIIDHKEPLSKGGSNKFNNLWLLCIQCDREKGSEILPEVINDRLQHLKNKYRYLK